MTFRHYGIVDPIKAVHAIVMPSVALVLWGALLAVLVLGSNDLVRGPYHIDLVEMRASSAVERTVAMSVLGAALNAG